MPQGPVGEGWSEGQPVERPADWGDTKLTRAQWTEKFGDDQHFDAYSTDALGTVSPDDWLACNHYVPTQPPAQPSEAAVREAGELAPHSRRKYYRKPFRYAGEPIQEGHRWIGGEYARSQAPAQVRVNGFEDAQAKLRFLEARRTVASLGPSPEPGPHDRLLEARRASSEPVPHAAGGATFWWEPPPEASAAGQQALAVAAPLPSRAPLVASKSWLSRPRSFNETKFDQAAPSWKKKSRPEARHRAIAWRS